MRDIQAVLGGPRKAEAGFPSDNSVAVYSGKWENPSQDVFLLVTLSEHLRLQELVADPVETFEESLTALPIHRRSRQGYLTRRSSESRDESHGHRL